MRNLFWRFFGIAVLWTVSANAEVLDLYQEAIQASRQGDSQAAVRSLEKAYEQETTPKRKAIIANALARFSQDRLQKQPREFYAMTAAKDHLSHADREIIYRIAGDSSFDSAHLSQAFHAYQEILDLEPPAEFELQEYATLKQGWVYLNLKMPREAFALWTKWWTQNRSHGELIDSIVKDSGRAWVESFSMAPKSPLALPEFPLTKEEESQFTDGLILGSRRTKLPVSRALIALQSKTDVYTALLEKLLDQNLLAQKNACDILVWFEQASPDRWEPQRVAHYTQQCSQTGKTSQLQLAIKISEKLKGSLLNSAFRANLYSRAHEKNKACLQWLQQGQELLHSNQLTKLPPVLNWIEEECQTPDPQLVVNLLSNPSVSDLARQNPKKWVGPLSAFSKVPEFVPNLILYKDQWKDTPLPIITLAAFRNNPLVVNSLWKAFPANEASGSDHAAYAEILHELIQDKLAAHDIDGAHQLLENLWPFDQAHSVAALRLWAMLAISWPEPTSVDRQLALALIHHQQSEVPDLRSSALLLIRAGQWAALFNESKTLSRLLVQEPDLAELSLEQALEPNAASVNILFDEPIQSYILAARTLLHSDDTWKGKLPAVPKIFSKTPSHRKIERLAAIREYELPESTLSFTLGPDLERKLGATILKLKSRMQKTRKATWDLPAFQLAAERSLSNQITSLSSAIDRLAGTISEPQTKSDLQDLSQTILEWIEIRRPS